MLFLYAYHMYHAQPQVEEHSHWPMTPTERLVEIQYSAAEP